MRERHIREKVGEELYAYFLKNKMPRKLCKQRSHHHNRSNYPSEAWFARLLKQRNLPRPERNFPLFYRFFGDFVWEKYKLIVEIDGPSHDNADEYDQKRDAFLARLGYRTFRIRWNDGQRALEIIDLLEKTIPAADHKKIAIKQAKLHNAESIRNLQARRLAFERDLRHRKKEQKLLRRQTRLHSRDKNPKPTKGAYKAKIMWTLEEALKDKA